MMTRQFFATSMQDGVMLVEIRKPVGSLADSQIIAELDEVIGEFRAAPCGRVIVDFCQTAYFGSSLLEALRNIWNEVQRHGGKMVLCNLSPVGREIVEVAKFDHLWPIHPDRTAALSEA